MSIAMMRCSFGDDGLDRLIDRALDDMANAQATTSPSDAPSFVVFTPARLRPYVERRVLARLADARRSSSTRVISPGTTLAVHSLSSFARSAIGNCDGAKYAKPVLSMFTLRAMLAKAMHDDPATFASAGEVFGSANQFASQVSELMTAGISAEDLAAIANEHDDSRIRALSKLLTCVEHRFGNKVSMPGAAGDVIVPWLRDHGHCLMSYWYGFEHLNASELQVFDAAGHYGEVVLADADVCLPSAIAILAQNSKGNAEQRASDLPEITPCPQKTILSAADDANAELRMVVDEIKRLHDDPNSPVPYHEILVTARDLSPYHAQLETQFAAAGIPVNATPVATMLNHPLGKLWAALTNDTLKQRKSSTVMRLLRTGLLHITGVGPNETDTMERLLIESDPQTLWSAAYDGPCSAQIQAIDAVLAEAQSVFHAEADNQQLTLRQAISRMVQFLADYGVTQPQSQSDSVSPEHNERIAWLAEQTRQVWTLLMRAFDELIAICGDEPYADFAPTFADNVTALLASQPLSAKPRALNAVDVVAFPTAMRPYAHVFVLGASETQLPAVPHENGLLDDSERELIADWLVAHGKRIVAMGLRSLTVASQARREPLAFNRLTYHAGTLHCSLPRNVAGTAQQPSKYLASLTGGKTTDPQPQNFSPRAIPTVEFAPNDIHTLDAKASRRLFTTSSRKGDSHALPQFHASVSAIESDYSNPYEYFLSRGLKLDEPHPFTLDAAAIGTFYHSVLEHALNLWMRERPDEQPEPDAFERYIDECSALRPKQDAWSPVREAPGLAVLDSSNRMRAVHQQLVRNLKRFVRTFDAHRAAILAELSPMGKDCPVPKDNHDAEAFSLSPLAAEHTFGFPDSGWPALDLGDCDGVHVMLRGKVDRLDVLHHPELSDALWVIDYKSSAHGLFAQGSATGPIMATRVYHGHELQLFAYADAALHNNPSMPLAAAMFLPIAVAKASTPESLDSLLVIPEDPALPKLFDSNGYEGVRLSYQPPSLPLDNAGMSVSVRHTGKSKTFAPLDIDNFRRTSDFVRFRIFDAAQHILSGNLPIRPYRDVASGGTEVFSSPYASVMALDLLDDSVFDLQSEVSLDDLLAGAGQLCSPSNAPQYERKGR